MDTNSILPFVMLNTVDAKVRARAFDSVMMTSVPVAPAVRGSLAALAVTQQAQDGIRREQRASEETVTAVERALASPGTLTVEALSDLKGLGAVDTKALVDRLNNVVEPAQKEVVDLANTLMAAAGKKIAEADLVKLPTVNRLITGDDRKNIVA